MSGTTACAAIAEMVRAKFGDTHFDKTVGQPTPAIIQLITTQISEVASSFFTRQWKGHHGYIAFVLDKPETRLLTGISDLACGPIPEPDAINPAIQDDTKGHNLLKLQEDQKTL